MPVGYFLLALYQRIDDKDYGSIVDSIIAFQKRPYQYKTIKLTTAEAMEEGYDVKIITTQYQCFIRIDLWLIVLRFQWFTKLNKTL